MEKEIHKYNVIESYYKNYVKFMQQNAGFSLFQDNSKLNINSSNLNDILKLAELIPYAGELCSVIKFGIILITTFTGLLNTINSTNNFLKDLIKLSFENGPDQLKLDTDKILSKYPDIIVDICNIISKTIIIPLRQLVESAIETIPEYGPTISLIFGHMGYDELISAYKSSLIPLNIKNIIQNPDQLIVLYNEQIIQLKTKLNIDPSATIKITEKKSWTDRLKSTVSSIIEKPNTIINVITQPNNTNSIDLAITTSKDSGITDDIIASKLNDLDNKINQFILVPSIEAFRVLIPLFFSSLYIQQYCKSK